MITRREFLRLGAGAAAVAMLPPVVFADKPGAYGRSWMEDLDDLQRGHYFALGDRIGVITAVDRKNSVITVDWG